MEEIKKYKDKLNACSSSFKIYFTKLEFSGFSGLEPILADTIQKDIAFILENTDLGTFLSKIQEGFNVLFQIQNLLSEFYVALARMYQIFKSHTLDISKQGTRTSSGSTMSYSYLSDLHESFVKITEIYNVVEKDNSRSAITDFLSEYSGIQNIRDLESCKNIYKTYLEKGIGQNVIVLYSVILQRAIDKYTGSVEGKEIIKQIIKDVEELKTNTLLQGAPPNVSNFNKEENVVQKLLQKFNLIPDSVDRPLVDLLQDITSSGKMPLSDIARLLSSGNVKKFGFIIIRKIIRRPIFHNIWTLTDNKYLESRGLCQEKSVGVSAKSLERSKTITLGDLDPVANKETRGIIKSGGPNVDFIDNMFDDTDNSKNYYFVLETLDENNFHFLVPWNSDIKYIPAVWLEQLKNNDHVPSRRIASYNTLLNSEILSHIQEPFVEISQFSREELQMEESYWRSSRNTIKNSMMNYARNIISDWDVISVSKVNGLLSGKNLYQKLISVIVGQISMSENSSPRVDEEMFLSYFRDIDKIHKGFKRDVVDTYKSTHEEKLKKLIGVGNVPESKMAMTKNQILLIFGEILDEVLEKYINRKSNIYITLDRKVDLLNRTLNQ